MNREQRYGYRGQRVGEASLPGPVHRLRRIADLRNVFSRLGTQSTMVDGDDNRRLLHDRTSGPEVFFLSDDEPLAPEPDKVANEGTQSVLVSCDAART